MRLLIDYYSLSRLYVPSSGWNGSFLRILSNIGVPTNKFLNRNLWYSLWNLLETFLQFQSHRLWYITIDFKFHVFFYFPLSAHSISLVSHVPSACCSHHFLYSYIYIEVYIYIPLLIFVHYQDIWLTGLASKDYLFGWRSPTGPWPCYSPRFSQRSSI